MPEWFASLAYITLAVCMVIFLSCIAVGIVMVAAVTVRDWLMERKEKRSVRGKAMANNGAAGLPGQPTNSGRR